MRPNWQTSSADLEGSVVYAQHCPSIGEELSAFGQDGSRATTILCATVFRPFITVFDGFSGQPEAEIRPKNQALDRFSPVPQPLENGENRENGDGSQDEASSSATLSRMAVSWKATPPFGGTGSAPIKVLMPMPPG